MTIKVIHWNKVSTISAFTKDEHYGWIFYDRKIHKYESESDYKSLITEDNTYGDNATLELFNYLKTSRDYNLTTKGSK